ncbi:MAG: heme exporter protein CcmB [Pseudomonadota bacterium]|nr:heme exporter protein CcmB [Pseudomonadota bacterium]
MSDHSSVEPSLWSGLTAVIKRDLLLAFRQRSDMVNPLFFFVMVIALFPLGVGPEPATLRMLAPGVIWIAALLSTLLSVDSLFRQDFDDGSLELVLLSPQPLFVVALGKVLAHWMITAVPLICVTPVLGIMLFMDGNTLLATLYSLLLGTPILSMISAIGAALTVGLRKGGVLIAVIALPLYVPVLIFGTSAVEAAAMTLPYVGQLAYLGAFLVLALTFAPFAIGAALRISVNIR